MNQVIRRHNKKIIVKGLKLAWKNKLLTLHDTNRLTYKYLTRFFCNVTILFSEAFGTTQTYIKEMEFE